MKVAIIGLGFVGLSLAAYLGSKKIKVTGIDLDNKKLQLIKKGIPPFYENKLKSYLKKAIDLGTVFESEITKKTIENDLIFVTVGTPIDKNNKINLKFIKSVANSLENNMRKTKYKPTIIIKSTVIPGTTIHTIKPILERNSLKESIDFNLLTNPEFLKEGTAMNDTINPHAIVIGGTNNISINKLLKFYQRIYSKKNQIIKTNNSTAEMIKYANNSFLATKISFINSLSIICQKIEGVNIDEVAHVMGLDPRISKHFLKAGPGYGGSCFPKDLQALISFSNSIGYKPELLAAVNNTNNNQVKKIMDLITKNISILKNAKIGILGLAFKENTDDIRESVSINLIKLLLKKKCKIIAHDPMAIENTYQIFKNKITFVTKPELVCTDSDCIILLTPWKEYQFIKEKNFLKMKKPLIIDTRRILKIKNKKIKYIGLGMGKK